MILLLHYLLVHLLVLLHLIASLGAVAPITWIGKIPLISLVLMILILILVHIARHLIVGQHSVWHRATLQKSINDGSSTSHSRSISGHLRLLQLNLLRILLISRQSSNSRDARPCLRTSLGAQLTLELPHLNLILIIWIIWVIVWIVGMIWVLRRVMRIIWILNVVGVSTLWQISDHGRTTGDCRLASHLLSSSFPVGLLERQTHWTIGSLTIFPVIDNLSGARAMCPGTSLTQIASGHVVQHILHCLAMLQSTIHILSPLTLVSVQQKYQLLLYQLPLLGIGQQRIRLRSHAGWRVLGILCGSWKSNLISCGRTGLWGSGGRRGRLSLASNATFIAHVVVAWTHVHIWNI